MNNEKPGKLINMRGNPGEVYCAQSGRKYTAGSDGVISNVDDRDRGDLNGLGAEELRAQVQPSDMRAFAPMEEDHNFERHQAGDELRK